MNKEFKIVDLTHLLTNDVPTWDGNCGFALSIDTDYKDCAPPDLFRIQKIKCGAGIGTHMDSPAHVVPDGRTIDKLTLEELIIDCIVIDVSHEATESYVVMPPVIDKFEKKYGKIQLNTFIIFYTGWDRYWATKEKYRNEYKFPSIHESTAKMLLERGIMGIGTDTLSVDTGLQEFPVHRAVLGTGKYLVENIANARELPATGAKILILPMKIKDGTEAPIRLIALF